MVSLKTGIKTEVYQNMLELGWLDKP